jgi:cholesterol oxidase
MPICVGERPPRPSAGADAAPVQSRLGAKVDHRLINRLHGDAFEREREPFGAVVIGSGFGGAVAAWRIKEMCPDARILVLERGMPYPPGSFPRVPREMRRNFWDPDAWLYGLFEVWSFEHTKAIVASGLGGGSLIYANVMLKKPPESFTVPNGRGGVRDWPVSAAQLADHYKAVKDVLEPTKLPPEYRRERRVSAAAVPKTEQFIKAAKDAGIEKVHAAKLAVKFANDGDPELGAPLGSDNLHDRERHTCTLVGECDLGCNEGAKNTLDYNFLSKFLDAGGEIRTCCDALDIAREGGSFRVPSASTSNRANWSKNALKPMTSCKTTGGCSIPRQRRCAA